MDLHERICKYLSKCPPAVSGQNGHTTTFTVACNIINGFGLDESQGYEYLSLYNARCQPPWSENELRHKVQQALTAQHSRPRGHLISENGFAPDDYRNTSFQAKPKPAPKPVLPVFDPATIIEKFLNAFGKGFRVTEADVKAMSPVPIPDEYELHGMLAIAHLFQPKEIVNFVTEFQMSESKGGVKKAVPSGYGINMERDELLATWELDGMPNSKAGGWLRMNPMSGDGIGDKNVVGFRHILLEFDAIPLDLQLAFLCKLPLPISVILTSGGRSVHAWVKCDALDMTNYRDQSAMLLKFLARFGVDGKNKNPSRLSRLPGVKRVIGADGDGRQRVIYLSPNPKSKEIIP
jgi:hypothetical protein